MRTWHILGFLLCALAVKLVEPQTAAPTDPPTTTNDTTPSTTAETKAPSPPPTTAAVSTPAPCPKCGSFSGGSFFGGILLGMVLMVIFYYAYKIWQRKRSTEAGYRNY